MFFYAFTSRSSHSFLLCTLSFYIYSQLKYNWFDSRDWSIERTFLLCDLHDLRPSLLIPYFPFIPYHAGRESFSIFNWIFLYNLIVLIKYDCWSFLYFWPRGPLDRSLLYEDEDKLCWTNVNRTFSIYILHCQKLNSRFLLSNRK